MATFVDDLYLLLRYGRLISRRNERERERREEDQKRKKEDEERRLEEDRIRRRLLTIDAKKPHVLKGGADMHNILVVEGLMDDIVSRLSAHVPSLEGSMNCINARNFLYP